MIDFAAPRRVICAPNLLSGTRAAAAALAASWLTNLASDAVRDLPTGVLADPESA